MLAIFLVSLFAVGAVSAADNSTDNIVGLENEMGDSLGVENQVDVLNENEQSFFKLNETINAK